MCTVTCQTLLQLPLQVHLLTLSTKENQKIIFLSGQKEDAQKTMIQHSSLLAHSLIGMRQQGAALDWDHIGSHRELPLLDHRPNAWLWRCILVNTFTQC